MGSAKNSANLNVAITGDTSKYKKAVKEAKQTTKDFQKDSKESFSEVGELLGVDTNLLGKFNNALKISKVNLGMLAGGAALAALAGVLKILKGEADAFNKSVEGVRDTMGDTAYINTYKQAMHDAFSEVGRNVDDFTDKVKEGVGKAWTNVKTTVVGLIANISEGQGVIEGFKNAVKETAEAATIADEKAEQARTYALDIYDIERKQKVNRVAVAKLDAEIAEYRERAANSELDATERLEANSKAMELIRQKFALQVPLANQLANIMQKNVDLVTSTPEEIDKAIDAQVQSLSLRREEAEQIKALLKLQKTLNAEVRKQFLDKVSLPSVSSTIPTYGESAGFGQGESGIMIPIRPEFNADEWRAAWDQLQADSQVVAGLVQGAFESMGESIGELLGDLVTGGDAWGNFRNSALSAFGDMAQSVGKIAIAAGVASLAIKASLTTLQGFGAIAAGTALVALGSAVKAGLSNVASGNYSASSGVASSTSSTTSSITSGFTSREISVNVTGTLQASGSQLVAVLNNENNRKNHTT